MKGLNVIVNTKTNELFRGIRCHLDSLLENQEGAASGSDVRAMKLGLSHSLSRYKLKFSADKVDTMVIQAVGLLDELDKEINTYAMRVKEWYGWHFPGTFFLALLYMCIFLYCMTYTENLSIHFIVQKCRV